MRVVCIPVPPFSQIFQSTCRYSINQWAVKESNLSSPPHRFLTPGLQSGLGDTTRVATFDQKYSEQDSNLQTLGLKPSRSTDGVPEQSSPGRIRTVDLLYVRQLPQPTRPQDFYSFQAEAVRLELTTPVRAHQFSKLAPHPAGWLPLTLNQPTQN